MSDMRRRQFIHAQLVIGQARIGGYMFPLSMP
jgi:hypothetical protein